MYLLLPCEDGTRPIIECPSGSDPEQLAQRHGATVFEPCDSLEEAHYRLSKDPNGKVISGLS